MKTFLWSKWNNNNTPVDLGFLEIRFWILDESWTDFQEGLFFFFRSLSFFFAEILWGSSQESFQKRKERKSWKMSVLLLLLLILLLLLLFPRFSCFKSLNRFTDSLFWIFKNWINFDCCIGMFLSSFVVVSHVNVRFHLIRFTVGFNISF